LLFSGEPEKNGKVACASVIDNRLTWSDGVEIQNLKHCDSPSMLKGT
jgi:hypothetical protein